MGSFFRGVILAAMSAPAAKQPAPKLSSGKYTFSKAESLRRYVATKKTKTSTKGPKKTLYVEKPFNKKTRVVALTKKPVNYPVKSSNKPKSRFTKKVGAPKVRQSLQPGTVLILLAGVHRGKRVVLLKALKSGLLLVTGPYKVNRVPVRRVHQHYVIATSTKLDVSGVSVPDNIDDAYFRRIRQKRLKKAEGDIFTQKKKGYKPSAQRKADQIVVDKQVLESIKSHADRKILLAYLKTPFGLSTGQFPHAMKF